MRGVGVTVAVLAAAATVAAHAWAAPQITAVHAVSLSPFSAKVSWRTSVPATGRVQYGTAAGLALWSAAEPRPALAHEAILTGLSPATAYGFLITTGDATAAGALSSEPLGGPLVADANGGGIAIDGQPFFPLLAGWQCPATVDRALAAGLDVFVGACEGSTTDAVGAALDGRALTVPDLPASPLAHLAPLLGWSYPDEPENHGVSPAGLAAFGTAPGLRLLTLTSGFWAGSGEATNALPQSTFAAYARAADVVGFDLYPLGHCRPDQLAGVYDAQQALARLAPGKPTFQWIETGPIRAEYCGGWAMSAAEVAAEVWAAVAGGADGIGYFTTTETPVEQAFGPSAAVERAMTTVNARLEAVAPALLTPSIPVRTAAGSRIVASARSYHDALYVIAVNPTRAPLETRFTVAGLDGRSLRRLEDGAVARAQGDTFTDTLAPLAARVYVAAPQP